MSLTSTTVKSAYTGNGSTNIYSYGFKIFDEDDLQVVVTDSLGVETVLTKTTDYTLDGVADSAGGDITLVDASQEWLDTDGYLDTGYDLLLKRVPSFVQESQFRNQGTYYPENHEIQFDKNVMLLQYIKEESDRALKNFSGGASQGPNVAAAVTGKGLYFDADGNLQTTSLNINELTPGDLLVTTINATTGVSDAAKVPRTDAAGLLDDSFINAVDLTTGAGTGSAVVKTRSDGFINPGFLVRKYRVGDRSATGNIGHGSDGYILCDTSSGAITLTDTDTTYSGRMLIFVKSTSDVNAVTFDPYSSKTIDGGTTKVMCTTINETRACIQDTDGNWRTIYHHVPVVSESFTPTLANVTTGNGTLTGKMWREGKFLAGQVRFNLGSTSAISGGPTLTLPNSWTIDSDFMETSGDYNPVGHGRMNDVSPIEGYPGFVWIQSSTTMSLSYYETGGTTVGFLSATVPFTWTTGDSFAFNFRVPITEFNA